MDTLENSEIQMNGNGTSFMLSIEIHTLGNDPDNYKYMLDKGLIFGKKPLKNFDVTNVADIMVNADVKKIQKENNVKDIIFNFEELEKYISFQTSMELRTPGKKIMHR
jgi:hypothetical protein